MLSHDEHLKSIPVIVLTGRKDQETVRSCNDLLAYYVPKGADMWRRLEPLVDELLDLGRGRPSPDPLRLNDVVIADAAGCSEKSSGPSPDREPALPLILCVDDDREFVESLKWRFRQHGLAVAQAFAGMTGYWAAFRTPARVILLDQDMPNGNGEYVMRRLKENVATRDIPVIVVTGSRDRMLERKMFNLGAADYFIKPIAWDDFWGKLQYHLDVRAEKTTAAL
jgi:CheY-like chemotaxis protein